MTPVISSFLWIPLYISIINFVIAAFSLKAEWIQTFIILSVDFFSGILITYSLLTYFTDYFFGFIKAAYCTHHFNRFHPQGDCYEIKCCATLVTRVKSSHKVKPIKHNFSCVCVSRCTYVSCGHLQTCSQPQLSEESNCRVQFNKNTFKCSLTVAAGSLELSHTIAIATGNKLVKKLWCILHKRLFSQRQQQSVNQVYVFFLQR